MRIVDLHCYPNTEPWIKSQGPFVEALAKYWNRSKHPYDRLFREWGELGYSDELMEKIFHGDAERILGL